jgi:site-specific DNA recombinase
VVLAFKTYSSGLHSDTTTAEILNQAGYEPSGRAKSGRFTREAIRYLLTNPFYVGEVWYGDTPYPGKHEPLIDRELWDQVQAIRARRRRGKAAGRKPHRVYLLARLVRCSHCGLKLVSQTSRGKGRRGAAIPYHYCPSRRRAMDCPTQGTWIRMDVVEPQVATLVERLQLPEDWRDRLEELSNHREERADVEGRRKYLQGKLRRLRELYLDGDFDRGEYDRRKAELQVQLDALRIPEAPDVEQAGEVLESLGAEWAQAPKRLQRDMLRTIFEAIFVDVLSRKVVSVKPYPPFVPLFRMDGLTEGKDGLFYVGGGEKEARSEDREVA